MKGIIYKLFDNNNVYFGSTIQNNLSSRLSGHKNINNNTCISRIFNGVFNFEIVEELEINNINELRKKEGEYIRKNKCINIRIDGRTQKEYRNDNKDKCLEYSKNWILKNPNKFKESQKKYYDKCGLERNERTKIICECGGYYVQRNKKIHFKTTKHINFFNNNII